MSFHTRLKCCSLTQGEKENIIETQFAYPVYVYFVSQSVRTFTDVDRTWTTVSDLLTYSLSLNLVKTSLNCFVEQYCSHFVFVKHLKISLKFS